MIVIAVGVALAACGKSGGGGVGDRATYQELYKTLKDGDSFAASTAKVQAKLGPPTTKDDDAWNWNILTATDCFDVKLIKEPGRDVLMTSWIGTYASDVEPLFSKCAALAKAGQPAAH